MSEVATTARRLAGALLPRERADRPPPLAEIEVALAQLRELRALDVHDEVALHEAGETLLRLREAAAEWEQAG